MWGKSDAPEWNAFIGVSSMMFLNMIFLGLLLELFGIRIFVVGTTPKKIVLVIAIALFGLNYLLFTHSGKYKTIAKEYHNEKSKERNTIILWLYIILSFLFPILLAIFMDK